jgi:hypothetical protein
MSISNVLMTPPALRATSPASLGRNEEKGETSWR